MAALNRAQAGALTGIFAPGSAPLFESLRTLAVSPKRFVTPGETIRVTFSFSNLGGAAATGVRVRFAVPPGVTHLPETDTVDDAPLASQERLVATEGAALEDLEPGAARTVACSFRVNEPIENGTVLAFQAALAGDQTPLVASNIERVTVRSEALLRNAQTLVTLAAPDAPKPGDTIAIRAIIVNAGQSSAHDVTVILPVPEHTTYVARSARVAGRALLNVEGEPFDYASETVVAQRLGPGQSVIVEYQAAIDAPLADGTRIGVRGVVAAREVAEFAIASAEIVVNSPVDFENDETKLTLSCDDVLVPGMRVPILLRAVNTGTGQAQNVSVAFDLPAGLVYTPGSAHVDGQPVGDEGFAGNAFVLGHVPAGRVTEVGICATVAVPADDGVELPVVARLRWNGRRERRFARTLRVRVASRFTRARNYIGVDRAAVRARDDVSFSVRVFNDGTAPERNVQLRLIPGAFLEDVRVAESPEEPLPYLEPLALGTVRPHVERLFTILARVAAPVPDRSQLTLGAVLELESGSFDVGVASVVVRSRPQLDARRCNWEALAAGPLRPGQTLDVVIRFGNEGSDVLRDARLDLALPPELALERAVNARRDANVLHFGDVAAGTTHEAHVTVRLLQPPKRESTLLVEGALVGRGISPVQLAALEIETYAQPQFEAGAQLVSNPVENVNAGERVVYELRLQNSGDGPAERLAIRAVPSNLAVYVPGSTSINGLTIADDLGASQLWSQRGLMLTDVNPGFDLRIRWETIVMSPLAAGTVIDTRVVVEWDGEASLALAAPPLRVLSNPSLEATAAGTPISIAQIFPQFAPFAQKEASERGVPLRPPESDAREAVPAAEVQRGEPEAEVRQPVPPAAREPVYDAPMTYRDFTPQGLVQTLRVLEKSDASGLLAHVFAIRALFPEGVLGGDEGLQQRVQSAAHAVRAPLDRLFVRLRIPRLSVTAKDLEDRDARYALRELVAALGNAPPSEPQTRPAGLVRLTGTIDREALRSLAGELERAPLGAVAPWIVNAHLVGTHLTYEGGSSDAPGRYRTELLEVFSLLGTLPMQEFHRVLGTSVNRSLDDALAALLEALRDAARVGVE